MENRFLGGPGEQQREWAGKRNSERLVARFPGEGSEEDDITGRLEGLRLRCGWNRLLAPTSPGPLGRRPGVFFPIRIWDLRVG